MESEDSEPVEDEHLASRVADLIRKRFVGGILYYTVKYTAVAILLFTLIGVLAPGSAVGDVISDFNIGSSEPESASQSSSGGGSPTSSDPQPTPDFQLTILDRRPCEENERLCREVDIELHNTGTDATNVDVAVDIVTEGVFSDATIYETSESVGEIKGGESIQRTERIRISAADVPSVQANGCTVSAKVHIDSDEYSDTYWTDPEEVGC